MQTAICNTCNELFSYKGAISRQVCQCGSKDLSAVHAVLKFEGNVYIGVEYYDRKGQMRRFVSQGCSTNSPKI